MNDFGPSLILRNYVRPIFVLAVLIRVVIHYSKIKKKDLTDVNTTAFNKTIKTRRILKKTRVLSFVLPLFVRSKMLGGHCSQHCNSQKHAFLCVGTAVQLCLPLLPQTNRS